MLLFSSGLIDHVITILTTWLFIVVGKKTSAQSVNAMAIELSKHLREKKIILNDFLAPVFDLDM